MKPKHIVVSLPVEDPEKSLRFYREGLEVETSGIDEGIISIELPGLSLFLIERGEFAKYADKGKASPHISQNTVECIFSCALDTREEVDVILRRAKAAGGTVPGPAEDQPWGYTGYCKDPDGHLWEIVWSRKAEA